MLSISLLWSNSTCWENMPDALKFSSLWTKNTGTETATTGLFCSYHSLAVSSDALHFKNDPVCRHTGNPPTFRFNPTQNKELEREQHHNRKSLVSATLGSFKLWQGTLLVFPTGLEAYSYLWTRNISSWSSLELSLWYQLLRGSCQFCLPQFTTVSRY